MSDQHPLARRSCLAGHTRGGRYGAPRDLGEAGANLAEVTPRALALIARHGDGAAANALPLPRAGRFIAEGDTILAWVAPRQYLRVACGADAGAAALPGPSASAGASVIDLTGSRLILRIAGPRARDGLAKLVPIDLHPAAFGPGHAASTVAAHIPVLLLQTEAAPAYLLIGPRSYGRALWRAVAAALTEHGYAVEA